MKLHFVFLFILLLAAANINAQQYDFKNYTVKDGLASPDINQIFQDSRGYIWFATQGGGVSRFDGRTFKNFTKTEGLPSNEATCIAEDKRGNIWIGTSAGLSEFNGATFKNFGLKDGLINGFVYSILTDNMNRIWVATNGRGVRILNNGRVDSLTTENGLPTDTVYTIANDEQGNYWFGLARGIACYHAHHITAYNHLAAVGNQTFFSSCTVKPGVVWMGSASGQVIQVHDTIIENIKLPPVAATDFIGSIAANKNGSVWMATSHGALKYTNGNFTFFSEKEGLSVNTTQAVLCDNDNNVWIGTLGGGANLLRSEAFTVYNQKDGLKSVNISAICQTAENQNKYYIGTGGGGLYIFSPYDSQKFAKVECVHSLDNINVSGIITDKDEHIWVCAQEGIFVLEKKGYQFVCVKQYHKIAGIPLVSPTGIVYDINGNCWISTFGSGIFLINDKTEKAFTAQSGSISDNVLTIYSDSKSNVWAGTQDAGLLKFNGVVFQPVTAGPMDKAIWAIAEDNRGNLYLGSGESGLYSYNENQLHNFNIHNGLISNYITALAWSIPTNTLWACSQKGISKIKFNSDGNIKQVSNFDDDGNFYSLSINQNAIVSDSLGLIWLGAINGLWGYNPMLDIQKTTPPLLQISNVRLAYQPVDWHTYTDSVNTYTGLPVGLKLTWHNNHLTFNVQATTTNNVLYSFELEGQDNDWGPWTKNGEANYSNITPGKSYIFKAKAINSSGVESAIVSFPFVISAPWWQTWWFRLMAAIAIFAVLIAYIKAREYTLKMQNTRLEKTVIERTADLLLQKERVEEQNKIITAEKEKSEQLLRHTEELNYALDLKNIRLEELNTEKNNFLNIVAHDLKNPLGTVKRFAEILSDPNVVNEKRKLYVDNISITAEKMFGLVNNLLDTNFLESGQLQIHISEVCLNDFIITLQLRYQAIGEQRKIRILSKVPQADIHVLTDKGRLEQIIENYISNALKYCPRGSTIKLCLTDNNIFSELTVEDDGPGIKDTELQHLFEPYVVTASSSLYGENKTGLGLAVVRKIGTALGVETGYRKSETGSIFYIRFIK